MPWLNLNTEFGFRWSEICDWEETPEEPWVTNDEVEFHKTHGYWKSNIQRNLAGDDFPFRESFRANQYREQGWCFGEDRRIKVGDVELYKFVDTLLESRVGTYFNDVFSEYCHKTKKINNDRMWWFFNNFEEPYPYYTVDEKGLLQVHPDRLKRELSWREKFDNKLKPFKSFDYKEAYVHKITGHKYPRHFGFEYTQPSGMYEKKVISGYAVEKVQNNSRLWIRLTYEYKQAQRKANKALKKARKEKQYSFLTHEEQKQKLNNEHNFQSRS